MLRRITRILAILAVLVASTVGGVLAGLAIGGDTLQQTEFGTIRTSLQPARHGNVRVFVPLVDWKLDVLDHAAPLDITLELRGIDRSRARTSISSSAQANESLAEATTISRTVVRAAARRGILAASMGGLIGALAGSALVAGILLNRRWLLLGPLAGVLITASLVIPTVIALERIDPSKVRAEPGAGHAQELPYILQFARQLLSVGDEYEGHFQTALDGVGNLVTFAGSAPQGTARARSIFLVSDIHDNVFVLKAFDRFAGGATVLANGDFGQVGARVEESTIPRIASLGGRLVAVSGNHDSEQYMDALAAAGATVLDRHTTDVDGLSVAGYRDPLERRKGASGAHVLRVYGDAYARQVDDFISWFDGLHSWPDIVLVHQHGFGHALAAELKRRGERRALTILVGHDHRPHVDQLGRTVIIDGGSLGAGGPFAIGTQTASFAKLKLVGRRIVWVDIISVEPLSGSANARRTVIRRR
jgi:predicted phosphodiesterase